MTPSPMIVLAASSDMHRAVTDALVHHGSAIVYDPADSFPAFGVRVVRRTLEVDRGGARVGVFGSVKAAVRCGTTSYKAGKRKV